jgi:hypothetical protein
MPLAILRYGIDVSVPSTRLNATGHIKHHARSLKARIRKDHFGILGRIGLLLLPSLSIPFTELSLSSLMQSPIIIPSPIGMELFDVCTNMLYSSFTVSPRERKYHVHKN